MVHEWQREQVVVAGGGRDTPNRCSASIVIVGRGAAVVSSVVRVSDIE
jgi:hypothetical protein